MSSLNALKYKITVNHSYYAGGAIFLLYSLVITAALFVTPFTFTSSFFYILLLLIALCAVKIGYLQSTQFMLSESGLVERLIGDRSWYGKIATGSFYNGVFIFLILEVSDNAVIGSTRKQFITIYNDAVTEGEYRLIARVINSGRH